MNWLFLTLLSVLFSALAGILQKVLMKDDKSNPYSYAIIFQFLLTVISIPVSIIHGLQLPPLNINLVSYIMAAALWATTTVFLFKALKLIEASEATILSSGSVIITIVASIMFLGEGFSKQKILGTILILISVALVTNLKRGLKFNRGVLYILVTALVSGIAIVIDSYNVKLYDAVSYNIVINILIVPILLIFYPKAIAQWKPFLKASFLKKMVPVVIVSFTQSTLYLVSLETPGITAQASVIRQTSVILTVLLAVLFLNERDHLLRKLAAAALVSVGVILLN